MPNWLTRLRDLVWTAVGAAGLGTLSIVTALVAPERLSLALSLGLAGVTLGLLATRE